MQLWHKEFRYCSDDEMYAHDEYRIKMKINIINMIKIKSKDEFKGIPVGKGAARAEFDLTTAEPLTFKVGLGICRWELLHKHRFKVRRVQSIGQTTFLLP